MTNPIDTTNNSDLAFFGQVNASISHELKNIMAIISEAAGLLQDLTEIASQGEKIEMDMLKSCSQDIIEEIQRGFATVKKMNTFSHSVDEPIKRVRLVDVVDLMISLSKFLSYTGEVRFDRGPADAPMVSTRPFRLQNLIYKALVFAFKTAGPDAEIQLAIRPQTGGSTRIIFSGFDSEHGQPFASGDINQIAASISVEIRQADDLRSVTLIVPELIDGADSG